MKCCIISFLYIKPQLYILEGGVRMVVLYRFSTSNHNLERLPLFQRYVVLYRFSTSNHNKEQRALDPVQVVLYRFSTSNHNQIQPLSL